MLFVSTLYLAIQKGMNPLFLAILYLTARLTTKGKTANTPIDYVLVIATKP